MYVKNARIGSEHGILLRVIRAFIVQSALYLNAGDKVSVQIWDWGKKLSLLNFKIKNRKLSQYVSFMLTNRSSWKSLMYLYIYILYHIILHRFLGVWYGTLFSAWGIGKQHRLSVTISIATMAIWRRGIVEGPHHQDTIKLPRTNKANAIRSSCWKRRDDDW